MSDRAGSDSRLFSTSPDVCQIMEDINAGKHSRLRKEIKEELTSIKDRVKEVILVFYIRKQCNTCTHSLKKLNLKSRYIRKLKQSYF